jgi:hypothetical protein
VSRFQFDQLHLAKLLLKLLLLLLLLRLRVMDICLIPLHVLYPRHAIERLQIIEQIGSDIHMPSLAR